MLVAAPQQLESLQVPQAQVHLRYDYEPGMELIYASKLVVLRNADASPRFSSSSREEFTSEVRLKILARDPQGWYIVAYHRPIEHVIDGNPAPAGSPRLSYYKQSPSGEILECSDPQENGFLLLPTARVGPGSQWVVNQKPQVPGRHEPVAVTREFRFVGQDVDDVELEFTAPEVRYAGDNPEHLYTLSGVGHYVFDAEMGYVVSMQTESTMVSKEDDLLLEVIAYHSLTLAEE